MNDIDDEAEEASRAVERFEAWERIRPKHFLEHATKATSQYDDQYRDMAAEILALREFRRGVL